jgi:hypothetical protein
MFHVVNIENGKPVEAETGVARVWALGADAAMAARELTTRLGAKHQPRRVVQEVDWRAREKARFADGTYLPIPECWLYEAWWIEAVQGRPKFDYVTLAHVFVDPRLPDHFAHPSAAKDGMIAFTEDAEKGAQDRQTRLTPGRYLTRYFSDVLSAPEIARYAALYSAHFEDIELQITQDADEIERVYTNGPSSCMSKEAYRYGSDEHPARVYAGPDLALAFIESSSGVTARAVCWPERKVYSRIYGDEARLEMLLDAAGYSAGTLRGARVQKIEQYRGQYVMPYIDGISSAEVSGDYIVLGSGDLDTNQTDGLSGPEYSWECGRCEARGTDLCSSYDVFVSRRRSEAWCEHCESHHAWYCEEEERTYSCDVERVMLADGTVWSEYYFEEHGVTCEATGDNVSAEDSVCLESGETWSLQHFERHGHTCACGCFWDADAIACDDCARAEEEEGADGASAFPKTYSTIGHIARQGIDKSPLQQELPIAPCVIIRGHRVSVGDTIWWDGRGARAVEGFHVVAEVDASDVHQPVRIASNVWPHASEIRTSSESIDEAYAESVAERAVA